MLGAADPVLTNLPTTWPWKFLLCCWGSGFSLYQLLFFLCGPHPLSAVNPPLSQIDIILLCTRTFDFSISWEYKLTLRYFSPWRKTAFLFFGHLNICSFKWGLCNSDSPQIYYAGEDDLELLILRPLPHVTAGITGLPYLSQPQHLVLSSFFYSLHWHRRSLSPRGMLGTLLFPGLMSTVPNMQ